MSSEKYRSKNCSTGILWKYSASVSIENDAELISGEASIGLRLKELTLSKIGSLPYRFQDFADYIWDPSTGNTYSVKDASSFPDSSIFIYVGAPIGYPLVSVKDIQWKASVEKANAGVLGSAYVTKPLFVYDNAIRYYDIFDASAVFFDASTNLSIILEKAFLKDASNHNWKDSSMYSIYPNTNELEMGNFVMESSRGFKTYFDNYVFLKR